MNHRHAVFHRDGLPSALLQVDIASGEARQDQCLLTVRGRTLSWLQTGTTADLLFGKHATVAGGLKSIVVGEGLVRQPAYSSIRGTPSLA